MFTKQVLHSVTVMPRAVIFDVDGTLVDSVDYHARAWDEAFQHFGYDLKFDAIKQEIGKGGDFILQDLLSQSDYAEHGQAINQYRQQYFQDHFLEQVQPFSGVRSLFQQLRHNNIAIVLATSAEKDLAEHYQTLLKVTDFIDGIVCSADVDQAKPNPDVFKAALEKFENNFAPPEVIVVGDSPYDAEAAGKLALRAIGVLSGDFAETQLKKAGCIAVYEDVADLLMHYSASPLRQG